MKNALVAALLPVMSILSQEPRLRAHASESGTLIVAAKYQGTVFIAADSGRTDNGKSTHQGTNKLIQLAADTACAVGGHENEIDSKGQIIYSLSDSLEKLSKRGQGGDIAQRFLVYEDAIQKELTSTNDYRRRNNFYLLRLTSREEHYREPDGLRFVSSLVCVGISRGALEVLAATFLTDDKGIISQRRDHIGGFYAEGDADLAKYVFAKGAWPKMEPAYPFPTWFSFQPSFNAIAHEIKTTGTLRYVPFYSVTDVLSGIYWSTIESSCGAVLPPIRLWSLSSGQAQLIKTEIKIPTWSSTRNCKGGVHW